MHKKKREQDEKKDIKKILAVGLLVGIMLVLVPISRGDIYDFNNPDSKAYEGEADYHPPNDVYIGGEMGAQDYIALQASDDVHAYYSADWWYYEFHRFAFKINETLDKKQFYVVYEGYAVNGSSAGLKLYAWDNYSSEWEYLGVHYGRNDGIIKAFITGNLSHYINETGYLNILAETTYRTSCPFYYSYDGNSYILDGEGLLYSMLPWFERSSVVTLENLRLNNGKYKIKVAEELDETSYIDKLSLVVAEHSSNVKVYPDFYNNLHTIKNPIEPVVAIDSDGNDCMELMQKDNVYWFAYPDFEKLQDDDGDGIVDSCNESDFYKWLELEYPKPENTTQAKILYRAKETSFEIAGWTTLLETLGKNNLNILRDVYNEELVQWLVSQMMSVEIWNGSSWIEVHRTLEATASTKGNNVVLPVNLSGIDTD